MNALLALITQFNCFDVRRFLSVYVPVAGPPLRLEVDVSAKAVGEGASHELGLVSEHFVDNELHYRTEQGGREIRSRIDVEYRLLGRIPQSQMLRLLHKLIDLHGRVQVEASLPARAQAARPRAVRNEVGLALGGVAPGSFGAHVVHDPRCVAPGPLVHERRVVFAGAPAGLGAILEQDLDALGAHVLRRRSGAVVPRPRAAAEARFVPEIGRVDADPPNLGIGIARVLKLEAWIWPLGPRTLEFGQTGLQTWRH